MPKIRPYISMETKTNESPKPEVKRVIVETLPDHMELGWLAGYDAFEHALVIIDGESAWRSFHPSKVKLHDVQIKLTQAEFWERFNKMHGVGAVRKMAQAAYDRFCEKPWVVLAYRVTPGFYTRQIVAGYNRWTGEEISWSVPHFNDTNYDLSNATEVIK